MTTSNHILTGALIALVFKDPIYVLPIALLSHYILDALPHFGVNNAGIPLEIRFKYYLSMELFGIIGILILLSTGLYRWNLVTLASFWAIVPDIEWPVRYFGFIKRGKQYPQTITSVLHKKIQWCETKWGVIPEVAYFIAGFIALQGFA